MGMLPLQDQSTVTIRLVTEKMAAPLQNWDQALNSFVDVALKSNSLDKVKKLSTDIERIIYLRRNIYFEYVSFIKI